MTNIFQITRYLCSEGTCGFVPRCCLEAGRVVERSLLVFQTYTKVDFRTSCSVYWVSRMPPSCFRVGAFISKAVTCGELHWVYDGPMPTAAYKKVRLLSLTGEVDLVYRPTVCALLRDIFSCFGETVVVASIGALKWDPQNLC